MGKCRNPTLQRRWLAVLATLALAGCSYTDNGPIEQHYQTFSARVPVNDTIYVCSAYGCRVVTEFKFNKADVGEMAKLIAESKDAAGERQRIALTLAWMEKRVGDVVGTSADRPGDDLAGGGDPTQMDCVDVATNLTSYLLVLQRHGLLKHHAVGTVYVKEDLTRGFSGWPHYAAILVENGSKQRFAVDGWLLASGKEPEIVEAEKWYIDDATIGFRSATKPL